MNKNANTKCIFPQFCLQYNFLPCRLIHGVGEIDLKDQEKENLKVNHNTTPVSSKPDVESLPYLLLDLRDKDAFDQCHVIGGLF